VAAKDAGHGAMTMASAFLEKNITGYNTLQYY
jgi:hypothetical protein